MLDYKDLALTRQEVAADRETALLLSEPPRTVNVIESIRLQCGLSRAQMLQVLGEKPEARILFTLEDMALQSHNLTPSGAQLLPRARALQERCTQWQQEILARLQDDKIYTLREAAQVLDLSESYLYILVGRGIAVPSESTRRKHSFTAAALRQTLHRAITYPTVVGRKKGPLADSFLRWLEAHPLPAKRG